MKVRWTAPALADLDDVFSYLAEHYPALASSVERRIRVVSERVGRWPKSARSVGPRPGVRVVALGRYPYRIFYRVKDGTVEILHIHHTARRPWIADE